MEDEIEYLRKKLEEANKIIEFQNIEILQLNSRISRLENAASLSQSASPRSSLRNQILSVKTLDLAIDSTLASMSAPVTLTRDKSYENDDDNFITPTAVNTIVNASFSDSIINASSNQLNSNGSNSSINSTSTSRVSVTDQSPSLLELRNSMRVSRYPGDNLPDSENLPPSSSSSEPSLPVKMEFFSSVSSPSLVPKGLSDRLSMNSQERRKIAATKRLRGLPRAASANNAQAMLESSPPLQNFSSTGGITRPKTISFDSTSSSGGANEEDKKKFSKLRSSSQSSVESPQQDKILDESNSEKFKWKATKESLLFILHDNPQIGLTVAGQISSGSRLMDIMIESKDDKNMTHFILGRIIFSGSMEGIAGADPANPRGSQCLVCSSLTGYRADIKAFPTRVKGDIFEIDIRGAGPGSIIDITSNDKLKAFFKPCAARVDVILEPSHSNHQWFPYWEGKRKMAPQFRSKGIGYLRLGDDMSMFGCAFLSTDAGNTFLDDGAAEEWNTDTDKSPPSGMSKYLDDSSSSSSSSMNGGMLERNVTSSSSNRPRSTSSYSTTSSDGGYNNIKRKQIEELKEIIHRLRGNPSGDVFNSTGTATTSSGSSELKWGDRVQLLGRLNRLLFSSFDSSSSLLLEVISLIEENVTKQTNPHVVKAAIQCAKSLGGGGAEDSASVISISEIRASLVSCSVAWRNLILGCINCVRSTNKAISDEAKDMLNSIHGLTISTGSLMQNIEEILSGSKGKGTSSGSSNTSKIVLWLNGLIKKEFSLILSRSLGGQNLPVNSLPTSNASSPSDASSCEATTISTFSVPPLSISSVNSSIKFNMYFEKIDSASGCQKSKHLLWHREDPTRESAVALIASYLSHDALTQVGDNSGGVPSVSSSGGNFTGGIFTISRQLSRRLNASNTNSNRGSVLTIVTNCLSPGCKLVVAEIEKSAPRMYEKVLLAAAEMIVSCTSVLMPSLDSLSAKKQSHSSSPSSSSISNHSKHPPSSSNPPSGQPNIHALSGSVAGNFSSPRTTNATHSLPYKGAASIHCTSPRAPPESRTSIEALSGLWFEASLILKLPPKTEEEWNNLTNVTKNSQTFFTQMTSSATNGGLTRGALLQIVLPYDNATSLSDQAATAHAAPLPNLPGVPRQTLMSLRDQAVAIRRLIRVKMADEADLQQAMGAMAVLTNLTAQVEKITSSPNNTSVMEILNYLK